MAVLPEQMNRLNVDDARGSLRALESYIRYMCERIEHSFSHMNRAAAAGQSADIAELQNAVAQLSSQISTLQAPITALQSKQVEIEGKMETIETAQTDMQSAITELQGSLDDLADRVTALESTGTE